MLKEILVAKGMKQNYLAQRVGVSVVAGLQPTLFSLDYSKL